MSKTCLVIGAGPGNGVAVAQRFESGGYRPILLARSPDKLADILPNAQRIAADASDPQSLSAALAQVGPVDTLFYNAGNMVWGTTAEVSAQDLEAAWRLNVLGLHVAANAVAPGMVARGGGSIIVTGATASWRGGLKTAGFAQAKAAQRAFAQSLAKHWGPQGVHVALMIVDGIIDLPGGRAYMPGKPDEDFMKASDIADTVWAIAHQPRSAWTFEFDLRPFKETW